MCCGLAARVVGYVSLGGSWRCLGSLPRHSRNNSARSHPHARGQAKRHHLLTIAANLLCWCLERGFRGLGTTDEVVLWLARIYGDRAACDLDGQIEDAERACVMYRQVCARKGKGGGGARRPGCAISVIVARSRATSALFVRFDVAV